jgi:hypothetical protein
MKPTVVMDTEVFKDYFLVSFLNVDSGRIRHLEMYEGQALHVDVLSMIFKKYRIVTFNGIHFDLPILAKAMEPGATTQSIKDICDAIIVTGRKYWQLDLEIPECDHIDLIEVAPGRASLKAYGARMHAPTLQDLPIDPSDSISPDDRALLREYCENDLRTTAQLFERLSPQIELREQMSAQYGVDLRSKSDAQIAEAVIRHEVARLSGGQVKREAPDHLAGTEFAYTPPGFICFDTEPLQQALQTIRSAAFRVNDAGAVEMPEAIANLRIAIGASTYRLGIGGLHSTEESVAHKAGPDHLLIDRDVASYYPSIILQCGLRPENMGEHFTTVYRSIVERRLEAKRAGNKVEADSLKIVINGSFGKFGSPYSVLYSPSLLIQTTVTGQLALLMLIEMLEQDGISVVSANTDGIVIRCPTKLKHKMLDLVATWECITGFDTEATEYAALFSRDVNSYLALKPDGSTKVKGTYASAGLAKNPVTEIVVDAVLAYLRTGTPVEDTISACQDITRFAVVRNVKGGALDQQGKYLGRVARWYYATGGRGPLTYKLNGYTVARSDGAQALMTLPDEFPRDVDFNWYARESFSVLKQIGAIQ